MARMSLARMQQIGAMAFTPALAIKMFVKDAPSVNFTVCPARSDSRGTGDACSEHGLRLQICPCMHSRPAKCISRTSHVPASIQGTCWHPCFEACW